MYTHRRLMKKKSAVTAVIILISLVMVAIAGFADTYASARVTQTQINRLRAEKKEYERQKSDIQGKIDATEFELKSELGKKEILDSRIHITSLEIANINNIIDQYYLLIREMEYEVFLAQVNEETHLQRYRNRVRSMEENGIVSYLEIIFDSTSFSDLLARIDFVVDIMRSDERTYHDLQSARAETIAAKLELEEIKAELDLEKVQLDEMKAELDVQLEEAHGLILKLQEDIEAEQALYDQLVEEEKQVQNALNAAVEQLRRQEEAERQRRERERQNQGSSTSRSGGGTAPAGIGNRNAVDASGGSGGHGQLMWPMSGRVISPFGPRNGRIHAGLDIGAAHGVSVVASESGTVIAVKPVQSQKANFSIPVTESGIT